MLFNYGLQTILLHIIQIIFLLHLKYQNISELLLLYLYMLVTNTRALQT